MRSRVLVLLNICLILFAVSCASTPNNAGTNGTQNTDREKAKEIVQGSNPAASPAESGTTDQSVSQANIAALSPEERNFLNDYLSHLTYMVYYGTQEGEDSNLGRTAVVQANRYLIEKLGMTAIDLDQVEKNKEDQKSAYMAETGGSIDLLQYVAQKLNADVYVEIHFSVPVRSNHGSFYAQASVTMKIFDVSTATLLGSVVVQGPEAFSTNSTDAAASNAIAGTVWTAMPKVQEQATQLMKNSLSRGVRYEIIIQKTPDSRQIARFRSALARSCKEVRQSSYSPGETRMEAYALVDVSKIEDMVYAAGGASGLNDIYLVYSRGRSFTFNTGL